MLLDALDKVRHSATGITAWGLLAGIIVPMAMSPGLAFAKSELDVAGRIPFAPPLDKPLLLTWTVQRSTSGGPVIKTTQQDLIFRRAGRGYSLDMVLRDVKTSGPAGMREILALGDQLMLGQELSFYLDGDGRVIDSADNNGNLAKMLAAIDVLRLQVTRATVDEKVRAKKLAFLSRLQAMDSDAQRQYLMAQIEPLLHMASRTYVAVNILENAVASGQVGDSNPVLWHFSETGQQEFPISATQNAVSNERRNYAVDPASGLTLQFDRQIETRIGDSSETASDSFVLILKP